jgi:HEAT repeat protein
VEAGRAYDGASQAAVLAGDNREDDSQGHSLSHNPAARAIENAFMAYASRDLPALRAVLRDSNDAGQRALAAQVIAYTPNKAAVVDDLAAAIDDPSDDVRNNAMRALGVMAMATSDGGTLRGMMPVAPFVRLLDSPVWTDRNKAVMTLVSLSERRDPRVLAALRRTALPSLAEMARWKSREHALGAFLLLGRVAHMTDDAIDAAWMQDPETLLRVATKERSR